MESQHVYEVYNIKMDLTGMVYNVNKPNTVNWVMTESNDSLNGKTPVDSHRTGTVGPSISYSAIKIRVYKYNKY